jgi:hypothetical protein
LQKPDDNRLTAAQYIKVRSEAERALLEAGALGRFPTPIDDVMAAARVTEVKEDVLNEGFVAKLRREVGDIGGSLRRALQKVIGLFDAREGLVFIDRSIVAVRQAFVRLHETGHAFMKWQRDLYAIVEDSEHEIEADLAAQFDREANVFASEVIFQLDSFTKEADDSQFGILVPVKLKAKYGSSIYAAIRRYVGHNSRPCTVLVLNPPQFVEGDGFRAEVRRQCSSLKFIESFGEIAWPEFITSDHQLGKAVPLFGKRMSGRRLVTLTDLNGNKHECLAEGFTQTHQVFVLIHVKKALNASSIIVPAMGFAR